jgi:hypothetical protein
VGDNVDMAARAGAAKAVPVQQVDVATGEVIATFPSAKAAATAVGRSSKAVTNRIRREGVVAGYQWRRAPALHPRVAEMAAKVKEWRDLRLPDGTLAPGYQMSDNQLLRTRHGRITCGHLRRSGYWEFRVDAKQYGAHILLCSTFHGPRPFPGAVVLHKDDKYDGVTAADVRWGTQQENVAEAVGRPVDVLDTRTGERFSCPSVIAMGERWGVIGSTIRNAMKERRPLVKFPHLRFAYAGEPMPSAEDWAFKTRMRTVDSVTGEVRVFDNLTTAATAYGVNASHLSQQSLKGGVVSRALSHIRVERFPGGGGRHNRARWR